MTPVFDDGTVALYHGDYLEVLDAIDVSAAVAVVTDPPYGDTSLVWDRWQPSWPSHVPAHIRQLWSFGSMRMFLDWGSDFTHSWTYGQEIVWEKHNGSSFHADRFKRVHEFTVHWYRGPWGLLDITPIMVNEATARRVHRRGRPPHTGEIAESTYSSVDGGPKLMRSVIPVRSCHGHAIHPTEKPIGILDPLIRYSTNRGDTVLDLFAGSGSTLDAARLTGRRAIGIEAREDYCERACRRLAQGALAL